MGIWADVKEFYKEQTTCQAYTYGHKKPIERGGITMLKKPAVFPKVFDLMFDVKTEKELQQLYHEQKMDLHIMEHYAKKFNIKLQKGGNNE